MIAAAAAWLKVGLIAGFRQSGFARLLQVDCSHHLLKNSFGLWQCVDLCSVCKCQCVCGIYTVYCNIFMGLLSGFLRSQLSTAIRSFNHLTN